MPVLMTVEGLRRSSTKRRVVVSQVSEISVVSARRAPFVSWPQEVDEVYAGDPAMNIDVLWVAPDRTSANGVWHDSRRGSG